MRHVMTLIGMALLALSGARLVFPLSTELSGIARWAVAAMALFAYGAAGYFFGFRTGKTASSQRTAVEVRA